LIIRCCVEIAGREGPLHDYRLGRCTDPAWH
jgi:hypothetical protein